MIYNEMTINGVPIKRYNARLLDFSVGGTERSYTGINAGAVLSLPTFYQTALSPRQLSITLTFFPKAFGAESSRGKSIPEKLSRSTDNIVRFESDISNRVLEIRLPDGYTYRSFLQSCQTPSFDATGEQDVEYIFWAIRHKPPVKKTIAAGGTINCLSNTKTPCKISLTIASAVSSVNVCGVVIYGINANTEIIIDSEKGIITANGVNQFGNSTLIDFPYLDPGNNIISCSVAVDITVEYTPIYA